MNYGRVTLTNTTPSTLTCFNLIGLSDDLGQFLLVILYNYDDFQHSSSEKKHFTFTGRNNSLGNTAPTNRSSSLISKDKESRTRIVNEQVSFMYRNNQPNRPNPSPIPSQLMCLDLFRNFLSGCFKASARQDCRVLWHDQNILQELVTFVNEENH